MNPIDETVRDFGVNDPQRLIEQINREYAEKILSDTAKEKLDELAKNNISMPWLEKICIGVLKDYKDKPREFWQ